jgi:hypothetical protein
MATREVYVTLEVEARFELDHWEDTEDFAETLQFDVEDFLLDTYPSLTSIDVSLPEVTSA